MKQKTLQALRQVIKEQVKEGDEYGDYYDLYNIIGVVRGNDRGAQADFKAITIAIRGYIGFDHITCSGSTPDRWCAARCKEQLDSLSKVRPHGHDEEHYINHLRYAVKTIGKKNLIAYMESLDKITSV